MPSFRTTISCRLIAQFLLPPVLAFAITCAAPTGVFAQLLPTVVDWSVALPAQPSGAPVIAGVLVFVPLKSELIVAYRSSDGTEAWRTALRADGPLASDGTRLFVPSANAIHAVNADGSAAWQADAGTLAAPILVKDGWVIAAGASQLSAYRASDGSIVWRREFARTSARPAIEGNTVYLPVDDGRIVALDLASGKEKWARQLGGAPTEVLAFADKIFAGSADKYFYCLDADDGDVAWRQRVGAALRGRPAGDDERVFVVALDNAVRGFSRETGELRWLRGVPFRPTAGPMLFGGVVAVAGTTNEIRGYAAETGAPAGELKLPQALAATPASSQSGPATAVVAVTGSLNQEWTLSYAASNGVPVMPVEPITALPGLTVPIPTLPGR